MTGAQTCALPIYEAITRLYRLGQSSTLTTPVKAFLAALAPEIPWPTRIVFANLWITSPLIKRIYKQSAGGNALVSNTIAFTQLKAGYTDNVIPPAAEATVNIRLLPGTSIEDMINRIHDALNMPGIQIEILQPAHNASEVANSGSWVYQKIHECILAEFPGTVIVPGLVTATSDSRAYTGLTTDIFRFAPYQLDANALESIHGFNERISIKNYTLMIRYYQRLFMSLAGARE